MTTPRKIEVKAKEMKALMNAFESTYVECFETDEEIEFRKREDAMYCFYHLKDFLDGIISDMEELAGHVDVVNAIVSSRQMKSKGE